VLLGEAEEQRVEPRALLGAERREELVLDLARERPQPAEGGGALGGERDEMPAAVVRIAAALDEALLLELVEQADELAAVVAEGVGDRALGRVRALVERDQDRVVVRVEPELVVRLRRALLRGVAEPFEEEGRGRDELPGEPRRRTLGCGWGQREGRAKSVARTTVVLL